MIDLRNEPEIFDYDRNKPQILNANSYVENAHLAIGFASRCWKTETGIFDTESAIRLANEMCAYMRILSTPLNNLEFLEWKYGKLNQEKK